jgi:hypothetical protein
VLATLASARRAAAACCTAASASRSSQGGGSGGGPASSGSQQAAAGIRPTAGGPGIVVQGARTQRAGPLAPGTSCCVTFDLLPLQRGWARLPTFVVVAEADGRLLDSVHDVQVLVA